MALVAVTGASGHVGANLVRSLLQRGDRVRALMHQETDPESLRGLDIERVSGDVRDPKSLERAFQGAELVVHLAAQISIIGEMGGLVHETNVVGARNAGEAALACGVRRMLHMCSVHAFEQEPLDQPLDETRERVSRGPAYDRSKAGGEAAIRGLLARGLDVVLLHPSGIIGPFDYRPSRMGKVFLDLYHRRLPSLIDGGFDWVDVRDVASGSLAALDRGKKGESYLVTGHWRTVGELSVMAEAITGVRPPRLTSPMWLARVGAPFLEGWARLRREEPLYTSESLLALRANRVYVRDKALRDLGYQPRPTEDSVRDVYRWFAENGRLPSTLLQRLEGGVSTALLEDAVMRLTQLPGRIYVVDVHRNLSLAIMADALQAIWRSSGWRQPWGLVIVMHETATYDGDIRKHAVPPDDKRAVGTSVVTKKPLQRMVIKSIGVGLGLLSRFVLSAESTLDEGIAAQEALIKKAEGRNRLF